MLPHAPYHHFGDADAPRMSEMGNSLASKDSLSKKSSLVDSLFSLKPTAKTPDLILQQMVGIRSFPFCMAYFHGQTVCF